MQENLLPSIFTTVASAPFATAIAFILIATVYFFKNNKGLPPGPVGLPYFGYWPFLTNANCFSKLESFSKRYGEIFSFTSTGRLFVLLGSMKLVREAFMTKSEYFSHRSTDYGVVSRLFKDGVISMNGEPWQVARKLFLVLLKERGVNSRKTSLAGSVYDSIKNTMMEIEARSKESVNVIDVLLDGCCNVVRLTLFGGIGASKTKIRKFNELYLEETRCMLPKNLFLCGTFGKYFLFPFMPHFLKSVECHRQMEKIVQEIVNEHKTTYDAESPARDMIDEYFQERDKRKNRGDPTAEYLTDKVLVGSIVQFMGDGSLFAALFTTSLMTGLLTYPEEQDKLYNEIVEVVGLDRQPTLEDKNKLKYFNAYIQESMRTSDFFNFLDSQECIKETTLGGYRIPKGAILFQNPYSIHFDPEIYEEPEKFNPSRYLPVNGKRKPDPPLNFGIGKRSCIGESLIMMQCFLILTNVIQRFHLQLAEGEKISFESYVNGSLRVRVTPRNAH